MGHEIKIGQVSANGFTFKTRSCGMDNTGELVIFLHGFPESSAMWVRLMKTMADKNYRCFAFDQRGYSPLAQPEEVEEYAVEKLVADVLAIADTLPNSQKFQLVTHDWGSIVGWVFVTLYPERVACWSNLSTPHIVPYRWGVHNDPSQKEASAYIHYLCSPGDPELIYWQNDLERLRGVWAGFPQDVLDDYVELFRDKKTLKCTTHWYRAPEVCPMDIEFTPITIPIMLIVGMKDTALSMNTADKGHSYARGYYKYIQLPDADHWLTEKNYDLVEKEVLDHISNFPIQ